MILADTAGSAAIVTALGGVFVSLLTVYLNSRKQANDTGENAGHISALTDQLAAMAEQIAKLKEENTSLKVELQILRAQVGIAPPDAAPKPKAKAATPKKRVTKKGGE